MASYQEHALDGASPVELVVALYDGMIRFLHTAIAAVEQGDVEGRRAAVKRALAIVIHLQARLRMDIGGRPAQVLSEYYASIFALIVQASLAASTTRFEEVIACIRNVRDAWRQVASDPEAQGKTLSTVQGSPALARTPQMIAAAEPETTRWTA
jgi:flagellar protein FliS